ncbi:aldehyde dehydrogenase family protein, partial [Streptomyces bobili]|uniref:aldehyde dehydrogenase family protein n=1 Tax=Streptomyces bobili TaxID=67280 RepID=UPI003422A45A
SAAASRASVRRGTGAGCAAREPFRTCVQVRDVLLHPRTDRRARREIFGPILPILPYRDIDDAIAYVNARPRPLALYYFGNNDADRRKVLDRTTSGNGTIMPVGQDDLPFGGVGASGMGQYHGIEGFRTLSHAKGIYVQGRFNAARLLYAPFSKRTGTLLNFFLR